MSIHHHPLPSRLDSERLYLRPYQAGDGKLYFDAGIRNQEHLATYESRNLLCHLKSVEHAETVVCDLHQDWLEQKNFFWGIFDKGTDQWCGQVYVGLTNEELPEYTIGYVADVNWEGKGYIAEAVNRVIASLFEDLHAHRVISDCNENNHRSWRLLEHCGFTREGHLRENRRNPDGSYHGDYLYGLLQKEFQKNQTAR